MKSPTRHPTTHWVFAIAALIPLVVSTFAAVEGRPAAVITQELHELEEKVRSGHEAAEDFMNTLEDPVAPKARPTPGEMGKSLLDVKMQGSGISHFRAQPNYVRMVTEYNKNYEKRRAEATEKIDKQKRVMADAYAQSGELSGQIQALETQREAELRPIRNMKPPDPAPHGWEDQRTARLNAIHKTYSEKKKGISKQIEALDKTADAARDKIENINTDRAKKDQNALKPLHQEQARTERLYYSRAK